jgi:hypothetical protein
MKSQPILANRRARTAIGLALSLLLHALILFRVTETPPPPRDISAPGPKGHMPLTVRLLPMSPSSKPTPQTPPKRPVLEPPPMAKKTTPQKPTQTRTARKKSDAPKSSKPTKLQLPPSPNAPNKVAPAADISDMLTTARDRRRAAGIVEPDTPSPPQDDNAIARANIQHMMEMQSRGRNDSGGVFQITYKGVRTAEFIFRGWNVRRRNDTRQLIQVDAGLNGDVDRAIIRKIIEVIRQTQSGDFPWSSDRLGRVVTLSARQKDNVELEEFLMKEFFEN